MAIDRNFNDMLNEYLPEDLLKNEIVKKDWFLSNVEIVDGWAGGSLEVGFKESSASSIVYGALEDESNIGQSIMVRGSVAGHKHVSSSMIFNHRDLLEHGSSSKMSKKSFLKILPDEINDHVQVLREIVSCNLINGKKLAKLTANATAGGVITVDRPERLMVGQKLEFHDGIPTASVDGYVASIDLSARTAAIVTARGGATVLDLSAWLLANAPYVTVPGANTAAFSGLKDMLLSAANGGDAALYGQSKAIYTYLQSHNENGSAITATSITGKIFDCYTNIRRFYKGNPRKVVMSFKNMATVMKQIEASKGAFNVVPGSRKTDLYGYDQATIVGIGGGNLDLVAVQECDDDVILFLDMSAFKFHTNGLIRRIKSPEGLEYFTKRTTSGYKFILDHELFGELVLKTPQKCGIIFGISY
jgi:hypothetical protein